MKKKRKLIVAIAAGLIVVLLSAVCVYAYRSRFDPKAYVQAVLDVSYKGEAEGYMEETGVSGEEAEAVFEKNLDAAMRSLDASGMSEELKLQYRELFGEIAQKVCYTVGEGVKREDGSYSVPLMIKPVTLFVDTYEEFRQAVQAYADEVEEQVMKGEEGPGEEEIQAEIYQIYYDVLTAGMERGLMYGEAQDVVLHVGRNQEGEYEIALDDMKALDDLLIEDGDEESFQ